MIKFHLEYSSLAVQRAWLHRCLESLEVVSSLPVPEVHGAVVCPTHQHPVAVHCQAVHDGIVSRQVLDEFSFWAFPLLDVVRSTTGKHEELGVEHQTPHRLLVVGQGG